MQPSHPPRGLTLAATLRGHTARIAKPGWSRDGNYLASGSDDGTVRIWSANDWRIVLILTRFDRVPIGRVDWSPGGREIAAGRADGSVAIWDTQTGELLSYLHAPPGQDGHLPPPETNCRPLIRDVSWSPDGSVIAIASDDFTVRAWHLRQNSVETVYAGHDRLTCVAFSPDGTLLAAGTDDAIVAILRIPPASPVLLKGHRSYVMDLAWSHDASWLASASGDRTIRIWDLLTQQTTTVLEGHHSLIGGVSVSFDDRLLASKSIDDTVRLWRTDRWELVASFKEEGYPLPLLWHDSLAFHPRKPVLATLGEMDRVVRIWNVDVEQVLRNESPSIHLKIGRAVLAGDTGVGKSALALVLTGQDFRATESTHGRQVMLLSRTKIERPDGGLEIRELLLWDLAGQPGYRLVHQMALGRADTAVIVFDARSQADPFSGVRYWLRAVQQAAQSSQRGYPIAHFLVAARLDRGGVSVSSHSLEQLKLSGAFSAYFQTSSKTGTGVSELRDAIGLSIDWPALPVITSTQLFLQVREFIIQEVLRGASVVMIDSVRRSFNGAMAPGHAAVDKPLFASWLAGLEAHGVLRLLGFGDLVLLKPELLDAYASALVIAAGNSQNGLGALSEEDVLAGQFVPEDDLRLQDRGQERLLLLGTLDEMLRAELILREPSEEGVFLVFPSEMRHDGPASAIRAAAATRFRFEGPSQNIYSTLIVRLAHSGLYEKVEMWAGGAQFRSREKGIAIIQLTQPEESVAYIDLTFDKELPRGARSGLESYIERHLHRRAVDSSVSMIRSILCAECGTEVSDDQARRRRERNFSWIRCNVCEARIPLVEQDEGITDAGRAAALHMDGIANNQRDKEVAANLVRAKNQANDFDVFLAHNSRDKEAVRTLADNLRMKGISPWLDAERVPPGRWFQDSIQRAIASVRSAAIIIGPIGIGKWELVELRTLMSACVEKEIPVIPVLLPGVSGVPEELSFLRELSYVKFQDTLSEEAALAQLQWGILADRQTPYHLRFSVD